MVIYFKNMERELRLEKNTIERVESVSLEKLHEELEGLLAEQKDYEAHVKDLQRQTRERQLLLDTTTSKINKIISFLRDSGYPDPDWYPDPTWLNR